MVCFEFDNGYTFKAHAFSLQGEETSDDEILTDNHHHGMCDCMDCEMDMSEIMTGMEVGIES